MAHTLQRFVLAGALVLCAVGCDERTPVVAPTPVATPPTLAPVVAQARANATAVALPEPLTGDALAEAQGLLEFSASSSGDLARAGREDLLRLGDGLLPLLARWIQETERAAGERAAALAALGESPSPIADVLLAELLARGGEPWVRSSAAWYLGERASDAWVPDAVLVLKYEVDSACVRYLAHALAKKRCFAGIGALLVLAPNDAEAATLAQSIAVENGFADADALERARVAGEVAPAPTSPAFDAAVWRWVERLAEFQLRGVDDARYVLVQLGEVAADEVAAALCDENRYVRLHACQCLERMGPRGRSASAALALQLASPDLAPHAAVALGAVGGAGARAALEAALEETRSYEVRLGAARGLARLADPAASAFVAAVFERERERAPELAQALAEAWCASSDTPAAAEHLAQCLVNPALEPTSSGLALEAFLTRGAAAERTGFADLHAQWLAIGTQRSATFGEAAMWRARSELLEARRDVWR
jgi:HEAT repeat protein